jgi:uncharacterized Zn finger protein
MDDGKGRFKILEEEETHSLSPQQIDALFKVGEEVYVKDSRFRIRSIKLNGDMRLKLLPTAR